MLNWLYYWLGLAGILLICTVIAVVIYIAKRQDNRSENAPEERTIIPTRRSSITQCFCGSENNIIRECEYCNQSFQRCSDCNAQLSPCGCYEAQIAEQSEAPGVERGFEQQSENMVIPETSATFSSDGTFEERPDVLELEQKQKVMAQSSPMILKSQELIAAVLVENKRVELDQKQIEARQQMAVERGRLQQEDQRLELMQLRLRRQSGEGSYCCNGERGCPCGNETMQRMQCTTCHQPAMGCSKCWVRLSRCDCDESRCGCDESQYPEVPKKENVKACQQPCQHCEPCEPCMPCVERSCPKCPVDNEAIEPQREIESTVERSTEHPEDVLMNTVRTLEEQVSVLKGENCELITNLSECAQDRPTEKEVQIEANCECISRSDSFCDSSPTNAVRTLGEQVDVLRKQNVELAKNLSQYIPGCKSNNSRGHRTWHCCKRH